MSLNTSNGVDVYENNRRLLECVICGEMKANWYYGAIICEACKKFFIRSQNDAHKAYKCTTGGSCVIDQLKRLDCRFCRYQKCQAAGLNMKLNSKTISVQQLIKSTECKVCAMPSSGVHFGVMTCEACKGFFRRSQVNNMAASYTCKFNQNCGINGTNRTCKLCRFKACQTAGMSIDSIRSGRQSNIFKQHIIERHYQHQPQQHQQPYCEHYSPPEDATVVLKNAGVCVKRAFQYHEQPGQCCADGAYASHPLNSPYAAMPASKRYRCGDESSFGGSVDSSMSSSLSCSSPPLPVLSYAADSVAADCFGNQLKQEKQEKHQQQLQNDQMWLPPFSQMPQQVSQQVPRLRLPSSLSSISRELMISAAPTTSSNTSSNSNTTAYLTTARIQQDHQIHYYQQSNQVFIQQQQLPHYVQQPQQQQQPVYYLEQQQHQQQQQRQLHYQQQQQAQSFEHIDLSWFNSFSY